MSVTLPGIVTLVNKLFSNALSPMVVTPVPRDSELIVFFENAKGPMLVTLLGMVNAVKLLYLNA